MFHYLIKKQQFRNILNTFVFAFSKIDNNYYNTKFLNILNLIFSISNFRKINFFYFSKLCS